MRREFSQSFTNLYRDPFPPFDVQYNYQDHGGSVVRTFPSDEADQAGTIQ